MRLGSPLKSVAGAGVRIPAGPGKPAPGALEGPQERFQTTRLLAEAAGDAQAVAMPRPALSAPHLARPRAANPLAAGVDQLSRVEVASTGCADAADAPSYGRDHAPPPSAFRS